MSVQSSRRRFLLHAAAAAVSGVTGSSVLHAGTSWSPMTVGLQLFSLDAEMQADLPGTLQQVREIGFREVEAVGFYGRPAVELRRVLEAAGLRCRSMHIRPQPFVPGMPNLEEDAPRLLAMCRDLGLTYVVCPGVWLPPRIVRLLPSGNRTLDDMVAAIGQFTADDWRASADLVNDAARRARSVGLQLAYHNGNLEFNRVSDVHGYDILLNSMDPELVKLEIDCGWMLAAGVDPILYLAKSGSRVVMVHLKDLNTTSPNTKMVINSAVMGTGIVDWKPLLTAIKAAGVRAAFLEQEGGTVSPFDAARSNYAFMRHQG